jgi:hypothetical protein
MQLAQPAFPNAHDAAEGVIDFEQRRRALALLIVERPSTNSAASVFSSSLLTTSDIVRSRTGFAAAMLSTG